MAIEYEETGYYNQILTSKSYIDMTRAIQVATWDYISKVFFSKDFNRVIYTNPEYAFRKRIETLAKGIEETTFINNLQLPFANFYTTSFPEITKSASASLWYGQYDEEIEQRFHFYGILQNIKVQFFFRNLNDLRVAHAMATAESHSKISVKYIEEVYWRNKIIGLPVFLKIKNIRVGNEAFNESQWLEQNHLQAMTLDIEVESVQLNINRGLGAVQLPYKWRRTGRPDTWKDGDLEYYTQKCTLLFANKSWGFDVQTVPKIEESKDLQDAVELMTQRPYTDCDAKTIKQIASIIPNKATVEMVEGIFNEPVQILFNRLKYDPTKTVIDDKGEVTAHIDFIVKPSTYQYWKEVYVVTPTRGYDNPIRIEDCHQKEVLIDGLHPNSNYKIFFIARDINDGLNTIPLEFTTPVWDKEIVAGADKKDGGIAENNPETKPKDVPLYGLIGMGSENTNDTDRIDLSGMEL